MKQVLATILGFVAIAVAIVPATAAPLSDLKADATISASDLEFSAWQVLPNKGAIDPARIEVTALDDDPQAPGLLFAAEPGALTAEQSDSPMHLFFQVKMTSDGAPITAVSLGLDDSSIDGLAQVRIEESVLAATGGLLTRVKTVEASEGLGGSVQLSDLAEIEAAQALTINFQITVMGDFAEIRQFSARFLHASD